MFVLIAMHPYENDEVDLVSGPFETESEAGAFRDLLLEKDAHPDITWFVCPVLSQKEAMGALCAQEDEEEEDDVAP